MAKKKANGATKGALVYVVLDKSGSMAAIQQGTIEGVNFFTDETSAADPEAKFSLLAFDTSVHKMYSNVALKDIEPLTDRTYSPGGGTALLDAVGKAIKEIDEMADRPAKVVVVVVTDGEENSSHEYTREAVKALVEKRETRDKWQFLFLGANIDAFAEAGRIGLRNASASSATWQPTSAGVYAAFSTASTSTSGYTSGATRSASLTQDAYDQTLANLSNSPNATATTPPVAKGPAKPKRAR